MHQHTAYVQQASFGPEFLLPAKFVLDLTYVLNLGHKEEHLKNLNQGTVTGFDPVNKEPIVTFPFANLSFPGQLSVDDGGGLHSFLEYAAWDGNSNYNALLIDLKRPMTKNIGFGVDFTWGHNLSDYDPHYGGPSQGVPSNSYNYRAEYSNSEFDAQKRFTTNLIYALPFGEGKRWLSNGHAASKYLGGWQYNLIGSVQTGETFTVSGPDESYVAPPYIFRDTYANCIGPQYAAASHDYHNLVPGGSGFWMNPAAYAIPAVGSFGNCSPRGLHGPGISDWDMSVFKQFKVTESKYFEFRGEFFNTFNHPMFNQPLATYPAAAFGKLQSNATAIGGREIQLALKFYF
jgi:hypothetical protein